jgi:CRP-like cAMP-binding protein
LFLLISFIDRKNDQNQRKVSKLVTKKSVSPSNFRNVEFLEDLLRIIKEEKKVLQLGAKETVYSQGDRGNTVYFIKKGKVRISVVSTAGKEATLRVQEILAELVGTTRPRVNYFMNKFRRLAPSTTMTGSRCARRF